MGSTFLETSLWKSLSAAVLTFGLLGMFSVAQADVLVLNPISDGYVQSGGSGNTNFDTATEASVWGSSFQYGLMRFDIPASLQTGLVTISSVTLDIEVTTTNPSVFYTAVQAQVDWVADEVTYNNPSSAANGWDGAGGDITSVLDIAGNLQADALAGGRQITTTGEFPTPYVFFEPSVINDWADGTKASAVVIGRNLAGGGAGYGTLETGGGVSPPTLTIVYHVPVVGDFDSDADVDGADFLSWQRGESPTPLSASDLADWELNFGTIHPGPLPTVTAAIPEPSTFALIAMAAGIACSSMRRSYRG